VAKNKKRQHRNEGRASLVLEGEEFPTVLTVELWHRRSKGKRELIGSRRYEMAADTSTPGAADTAAVDKPVAEKRPRQPRAKTPPPPES
jgi:hypothetical protein